MKLRVINNLLLALLIFASSSLAENSGTTANAVVVPEINEAVVDEAAPVLIDLNPPAVTEDSTFDQSAMVYAAAPTPSLSCSAQATCHDGTTRSCSVGGSGTCTAINASCPNQQGYVQCGGTTTWCPSCSSSCNTFQCRSDCLEDCPFGCFCNGSCSSGQCQCIINCF